MSQKKPEAPQKIVRQDYIIHSDFDGVFSKMTPEQRAELKASILKEGFRDPFVVWEEHNYLLDGHNRDSIYEELRKELGDQFRFKPKIVRLSFTDETQAQLWMLKNQLSRRNLKAFQRIEAALPFKELFAAPAKDRKHKGVPQNFGEGIETNEEVAKVALTSHENVRKVEKILKEANKKDIEALRRGDANVSIHSVYQSLGKKPRIPKVWKASSKEVKAKVETTMSSLGDLEQELSKDDRLYFYNHVIKWAMDKKKAGKKAKKPAAQTQQK